MTDDWIPFFEDDGTSSEGYLRTNEHEEAVRCLEWAELQARLIPDDPYNWKWVLISLHSAVQGFMVLALWNGNGLLSFTDKAAKNWLKKYTAGDSCLIADCKLDNFPNLYAKIKDQTNFHTVGAKAFHAEPSHDESMKRFNRFRNEFVHFTPKGWSLELAGLPRICMDALNIVEFLVCESTAILWHEQGHAGRVRNATECFRRSLKSLRDCPKSLSDL